ncbi:MAG: hypothetical protein ACYDH9_24870 [Limisphaerales bacterium]
MNRWFGVPASVGLSSLHRFTLALLLLLNPSTATAAVDLTRAVVVAPPGLSGPENKAVTMLVEEVEKRTHLRWPVVHTWPAAATPVIAVGPASALAEFAGEFADGLAADRGVSGAEGFRIRLRRPARGPAVFVIGNDARGVLFGVGRLLRELGMRPGAVSVPDDLSVATAPKYPLRGHQLGYRPKTNSYDAWDLAVWEQYIRDLAVFGANAIELIPPRSDDATTSPLFPLPPMDMMVGMSRLAGEYGLDVWIWYPAMDKDYSNPRTVEFALREWGEVFKKLPRIDAVLVPGGDPGHTEPKHLLALLEKQTESLHRYHPQAQMWVSPQSFNQAWLDEFLGILRDEAPRWLSGVVFGPQVRLSLPQLRAAVPKQYPIRLYPDITHSRQCQFPVPDWDVAYALTEGRECINPRPIGEAHIARLLLPYTIGFLAYSEGCNDDVNKTIWSALAWDAEADVVNVLRQYSRYFIDDRYTEDFAQGLLALERDWQGPLVASTNVYPTLAQFQAMEKTASPGDLRNWRFQQGLYRAYYDAYTRSRLLYENGLEDQAMLALRAAGQTGAVKAIAQAEAILNRARTRRVSADWRARIFALADDLFHSIGMQLSVKKYHAIAVDRGANLDTVDFPLNDRAWLRERFAAIRRRASEADRLRGLDEIVNWTNPGPGGFYDDLGDLTRQPHLVRGPGFDRDPAFLESSLVGFEEGTVVDEPDEKPVGALRISWLDHAESLNDAPLQMRYAGLDPQARYKIRVVYAGDSPKRKIRLVAGDGIEIHPLLPKPFPFRPIEFDLPAAAIERGELLLSWFREPGLGGNGRGCQVSEVWLLKQ